MEISVASLCSRKCDAKVKYGPAKRRPLLFADTPRPTVAAIDVGNNHIFL